MMINSRSRKGKQSKKRPTASALRPAPTALVYRGPSRIPLSTAQNDVFTTQINNQGALTTTAGGVIATVFDSYSQASTPADWTNLANLYTEYRILSMDLEFLPWNKYNQPTTSALAPMYSVVDRSNNTAIGSLAQVMAYDSVEAVEPSTYFKRVVKMNSAEEAQWIPTGSSPATASRLYVKLYSSGNVASTTLYDFVARLVVQFRGRQ